MLLMSAVERPLDRALLRIGSFGPLGHLPASGTITSIVLGLPLFWFGSRWPIGAYVAATVAFTAVAVWLHGVGDRLLGEKDSRQLVWDELAGFLIGVTLVPFTWQLAVLALVVERTIDILKLPPARGIELHWPGGWGVVGDDVVAGLYTAAILQGTIRWAPEWVGL